MKPLITYNIHAFKTAHITLNALKYFIASSAFAVWLKSHRLNITDTLTPVNITHFPLESLILFHGIVTFTGSEELFILIR